MLFKKIVFPYIPESYGRYLTAGKHHKTQRGNREEWA